MAGTTPSRKQWGLTRGPKGNIQSLGWAEIGCPESQVKLAKELLEDNGEEGIDKEEKGRLAVYWLLKASEKGEEEATSMLKDCLENGTGVNEHNLNDVRTCLEMPQGEKLSREAAKELFASLSQGENFITSSQLQREIEKFSYGPIPREAGDLPENYAFHKEGNSLRLTEEMLIAAGSNHLRGELPAILNKPIQTSPFASGTIHLAQLPLLPQPILVLTFISLFGVTYLLETSASIVYYISLICMIISTCKILAKKWEFQQFCQWSYALINRGCSEEVSKKAQWAHISQNTKPFFIFISSLFLNLIVIYYVPTPPYSEIATISTVLSLFMLYNVVWNNRKINKAALFSFIVHLLARYPYELDTYVYYYWRYLDVHVPTFASYVVGNSIQFCLNIRVLLYLMLPGCFLLLASRDKWLGVYKTVLPLIVCLSWWQMAVSASKGATQFGLIRSCLGLIFIIIFLPLTSITTLIVPLFAVIKLFIMKQISIPYALGGICLTLLMYIGTKYNKPGKIFSQVLFLVISLLLIVNYGEEVKVGRNLNWNELSTICSNNDDLQNQEKCMTLIGQPVAWEGYVMSSKVSSVYNPIAPFFKYLPEKIYGFAVCFLGEQYEVCKNNDCKVSHKKCRISNWNRYEYEIELISNEKYWESSYSSRTWLRADRTFRNFTISLKKGDIIWFKGMILGWKTSSPHPLISLDYAKCVSCLNQSAVLEVQRESIYQIILTRIGAFIFYPIELLR